jgi:hypothetical protein
MAAIDRNIEGSAQSFLTRLEHVTCTPLRYVPDVPDNFPTARQPRRSAHDTALLCDGGYANN